MNSDNDLLANIPPALTSYCLNHVPNFPLSEATAYSTPPITPPSHPSPSNPLLASLRILSPILALSPSNLAFFGPLVSFPSRLPPNFRVLLAHRNPAALLIVGHWWAHVARIPASHWWLRERGQVEAEAVLGWLESFAGNGAGGDRRDIAVGELERLRMAVAELRACMERSSDEEEGILKAGPGG